MRRSTKASAESKRRKRVGAGTRANVYERDCYRCVECGSPEDLTIDHRMPRSRGGKNRESNLQTMCGPCNAAKADNFPSEVVAQRRRGPHGEELI